MLRPQQARRVSRHAAAVVAAMGGGLFVDRALRLRIAKTPLNRAGATLLPPMSSRFAWAQAYPSRPVRSKQGSYRFSLVSAYEARAIFAELARQWRDLAR